MVVVFIASVIGANILVVTSRWRARRTCAIGAGFGAVAENAVVTFFESAGCVYNALSCVAGVVIGFDSGAVTITVVKVIAVLSGCCVSLTVEANASSFVMKNVVPRTIIPVQRIAIVINRAVAASGVVWNYRRCAASILSATAIS